MLTTLKGFVLEVNQNPSMNNRDCMATGKNKGRWRDNNHCRIRLNTSWIKGSKQMEKMSKIDKLPANYQSWD